MNFPLRKAKIVATLGPSSANPNTLTQLMQAGVNIFRLNFSHGTHQDHEQTFRMIRECAKQAKKNVGILQDLQGPKLRVGKFPDGKIELKPGEEVIFIFEKRESEIKSQETSLKCIPYNYERLAHEIQVGHRILMDDGNLEVNVQKIEGSRIHAKVKFGGTLKNYKGMNFPDTALSIESFTPKDQQDLELGLKLGVDYVALSFVRSARDIQEIQEFMQRRQTMIPIVSKIEMNEAIQNLDEILDITDALMVARGDLAVEVGTALVPGLQKKMIHECNRRGIPVITATQMLESMISNPRPTRAEASDVANAIWDGSDAVMLSAETASGKYPVETVQIMQEIIIEAEKRSKPHAEEAELPPLHPSSTQQKILRPRSSPQIVDAIEHAATHLAQWINAKALVCLTHTGQAAMAVARYRPTVPVLAVTDDARTQRRMALVWGVECVRIESATHDLEKLFVQAELEAAKKGLVQKGDHMIVTIGFPPLQDGSTNLVKVVTVRSGYSDGH